MFSACSGRRSDRSQPVPPGASFQKADRSERSAIPNPEQTDGSRPTAEYISADADQRNRRPPRIRRSALLLPPLPQIPRTHSFRQTENRALTSYSNCRLFLNMLKHSPEHFFHGQPESSAGRCRNPSAAARRHPARAGAYSR